MTWLGLVLLLLLVSAAPAGAAINLVTSGTETGTNVFSLTVTPAAATGDNNTVVVVVALKNTAASPWPTPVTDSGGSVYSLRDEISNGTSARVLLYATAPGASKSSTWVKFQLNGSTSDMVVAAASYSGVVGLGQTTTGTTGVNPTTISLTTRDSNNWIVAGFAGAGSALAAASMGNLQAAAVANATVGGALTDNTSAAAGSVVSNAVSFGSGEATAMVALELRTVPAVSLISPGGFTTFVASSDVCQLGGKLKWVGSGDTVVVVIAYNSGSTAKVASVRDASTVALSSVYTLQKSQPSPGNNVRVEIWSATVASTATPNSFLQVYFTTQPGGVKGACAVAAYTGVVASATSWTSDTTADPSISWTTQDPNNVVVAGFASQGTAVATAFAGTNLRHAAASSQGGASTNAGVALTDVFSTSQASVTSRVTLAAAQWAAVALELRAPRWLWSASTSAANLAMPSLDPWSNILVSGSNDGKLHGMREADGVRTFAPFPIPAGAPIQSRPALLPSEYRTPTPSPAVNIAYVTSQNGRAYAVDTGTGLQVWESPVLGTTLQGSANVWIQAVQPLSICGVTADVVFVGTSNTADAVNNKVYALNGSGSDVTTTPLAPNGNCPASSTVVAPGGILWTFAPGNLDIISSMPHVDYGNGAVWVTSRSNGNTQPSVWKLNAQTGVLMTPGTNTWSLNDIDNPPTASWVGEFMYVATSTTAPTLNAIRVSDGTVFTHTPASGTGAIKGMPWWLSYDAVSGATPDTIVFIRNATVHAVSFNGTTFGATLSWVQTPGPTSLSAPVDDGAGHVYVGGSDGKVYQFDVSDGLNQKAAAATLAGTMGDATFNYDTGRLHLGASDGKIYTFATPLP